MALPPYACRRRHPRFSVDAGSTAQIRFEFPEPGCGWCEMALRDLSEGGLSFVLSHELPGLALGDCIAAVQLQVAGSVIRGEILVMHLSPDSNGGSVCGALFYPIGDEDVVALRGVMRALKQAPPAGVVYERV